MAKKEKYEPGYSETGEPLRGRFLASFAVSVFKFKDRNRKGGKVERPAKSAKGKNAIFVLLLPL
jgi:hypothetical protein